MEWYPFDTQATRPGGEEMIVSRGLRKAASRSETGMSNHGRRSGKEAISFTDLATGMRVTQLTNSQLRSVHGYYDLPPWSPRDRRIVFSSMQEPGATGAEIHVMDDDGGNITWLASSRFATPNDGCRAQWSADGRRVYYRDRDGRGSLVGWVDVDTHEHGTFPGDLRMLSPVANLLAWPSDVTHFTGDDIVRRRHEAGVFVCDLDTGQTRFIVRLNDCLALHPRRDQIVDWHLFIKHTKWTPQGDRLLFVLANEVFGRSCGEVPAVKDLFVVDADGGRLRHIGQFGHHPIWHHRMRLKGEGAHRSDFLSVNMADLEQHATDNRIATWFSAAWIVCWIRDCLC